jgi:hypothetical protein
MPAARSSRSLVSSLVIAAGLAACGPDASEPLDGSVRPDAARDGGSPVPDSGALPDGAPLPPPMDAGPDATIVRPPMPTPVCAVGACEDGFARTCGDAPQVLSCDRFGAACADQTDLESGRAFRWCDCGDIEEGDGICLGGSLGVVCSAGLGGLSDCGPGRRCESRPKSPFGIGCACDDLEDGICAGGCASDPDCESCTPDCSGRACGDNGCGGSCGTCALSEECTAAGACEAVCVPQCDGRACGDDGCGGSCGGCGTGRRCTESGACEEICVPSCGGRECGDNGCGGLCGTCEGGTTCDASSGACVAVCTPDCTGRACGDDGCGGSCGSCGAGASCSSAGACVPDCTPSCSATGAECGADGCGGVCGVCGAFESCFAGRDCLPSCRPSCEGRDCGDDGCGGTCPGACESPHVCLEGAGLCRCPAGSHLDYQLDATALTFTPPAPDLVPGAMLAIGVRIEQASSSRVDLETGGNTTITNDDEGRGTITLSGCVADIEVRTTYYVIAAESSSVSHFRCEIVQSFDGETDFVVQAPTVDLATDSCVATGLTAR